jgi:hypothetical protein
VKGKTGCASSNVPGDRELTKNVTKESRRRLAGTTNQSRERERGSLR